MKLGIQTNVWEESLHENQLAQIVSEAKQAGYDGFEIGLKRVNGRYTPTTLNQLAADNGLLIAGIHTGARFNDPEWQANLTQIGQEAAAYAVAASAPFVLMSGQRTETVTQADLVQRAETLNKLGRIIQEAGVEMCFHNHDWEFKHGGAEMDYLVHHTDPALVSFMIDIGWVHRAKQDTAVTIRNLLTRTKCYHIKDNTADDLWTEVGQGIIDWHAVFAEISNNPHDPWLTVERDLALPNALESAQTSANYLRQNFAHLVGGAS